MLVTDRIKECAKKKRLSVAAICAEIGMSRGYIRDVEAGKSRITEERLEKIAEFLGTTPEYLRGETDEKNKPAPETENEPIVDDEGINLLIQFYKFFSEDGQKQLMQKAFDIWQEERSNKQ